MALGSVEQLREVDKWQQGKPVEDPYHAYAAGGGALDEELFTAATECASTFDIKNLGPYTEVQAKLLASRHRIPLTDTLLTFYGILRERSFPVPKGKEKELLEITRYDQQAFAQALLLDHRPQAYRRFISAYPHIFSQHPDTAQPGPMKEHDILTRM